MSKEKQNEAPEQEKQKKEKIDAQEIHNDIKNSIIPELVDNSENRKKFEKFLKDSSTNSEDIKIMIRSTLQLNSKYQKDFSSLHKEIAEAIEKDEVLKKLIAPQIAERKKIEKNLKETAQKWFNFDVAKLATIQEEIKDLRIYDIRQMTFSPKKLKKFLLNSTHFTENDFRPKDIRDFLSDFKIDINELNEKDIEVIELYLQNKKANSELLEILINRAWNDAQKQKIIQKILGTISFSMLVDKKIIDKAEQDQIVEKIFEESFDADIKSKMTTEEKSDILGEIRIRLKNKDFSISINDIDPDKITTAILENEKMRENFEKIFDEYTEISEQAEEDEKNNLKTLDDTKEFLKDTLKETEKSKIFWKKSDGTDLGSNDAIDSLGVGSFIKMQNSLGHATTWRINEAKNGKINFTRLEIRENPITHSYDWTDTDTYTMPYNEFADGILQNLQGNEVSKMEISPNAPENITLENVLEFPNFDAFEEELNKIDNAEPRKKFEKNSIFTLTFSSEWEKRTEYVRVKNIDETNQMLTIRAYDGTETTLSWALFLNGVSASENTFKRIGKLDTLQDFADNAYISKELYKDKNVSSLVNAIEPDLILENGKISVKVKANENKVVPVWGFKHPEKPAFIEVIFINGRPIVTEIVYTSDKEEQLGGNKDIKEPKWEKEKKKFKESAMKKKKRVNTKIGEYIHNYEGLLQIMSEKGYTKPVYGVDKNGKAGGDITPTEHYEWELQEQENNELNGGPLKTRSRWFFGALSGMTTVGDLLVMGKMTKNAVEQYFEKHSKLRAAESLHNLFSKFWEWKPLEQLALKEFTNEVGSLIEAKMDMIRRLKGEKMRKEIIKILRTRPPEPVDILAAAMVTAEMGGHMYPDTLLRDLQWDQYYWFEAICLAIGLNPRTQLNVIKDKVGDKNTDSAHHPSESELITQLFKANQGNKYVQAINGGSKFWKKPAEWRNSQKDKGKTEAAEFSTPIARAWYAISKMESNEFEIALGAIEPTAGKSMGPKEMGIGFVWAASNAPNYVHHSTGNELRNVFYGGNSFHGFFFGKEKVGGNIYKDIINIALDKRVELGLSGAEEMRSAYRKITKDRDAKPYAHSEDLIKWLWKFWQSYYTILHPILQGTDPLLATIIRDQNQDPGERQKVMDYLQMFEENMKVAFGEDLKDGLKWNFKSMNATYQADNSFLLFSDGNLPYRSFKPLLSSLSFDSHTQEMNGVDRNGIWWAIILDYLKKYLRDGETFNANPDFQKEQYLILYKEIMSKLSEKMSKVSKEDFDNRLANGGFKHISMLSSTIGKKIEYEFLFGDKQKQPGWLTEVNENPDIVFARFKNSWGITGSQRVQKTIQNRFGNAIQFSANK